MWGVAEQSAPVMRAMPVPNRRMRNAEGEESECINY